MVVGVDHDHARRAEHEMIDVADPPAHLTERHGVQDPPARFPAERAAQQPVERRCSGEPGQDLGDRDLPVGTEAPAAVGTRALGQAAPSRLVSDVDAGRGGGEVGGQAGGQDCGTGDREVRHGCMVAETPDRDGRAPPVVASGGGQR